MTQSNSRRHTSAAAPDPYHSPERPEKIVGAGAVGGHRVDHSTVDESDVAVADDPSTSGAHWANRDSDVLQRRIGGQPKPFRRPPAMNSSTGETNAADPGTPDRWNAFAPTGNPSAAVVPDTRSGAWDAFENAAAAPADPGGSPSAPPASRPPRRNPADLPAGSGRTSFGVTDGPISGVRPEPVSPAGPPAPAAGGRPSGGEVPAFADLRAPAGSPAATGGPAFAGPAPGNAASADWAPAGWPPVGWPPADRTPSGSTAADRPARDPELAPATGDVHDGIGDLISGPGRDIRAHRAGDNTAPSAEPRRSRLRTAATALLAAVVLAAGGVAGVAWFTGEGDRITSALDFGSEEPGSKVATAPLDGRAEASFELIAATTKVTLRIQDLGDQLYRITSAGDSGTAPSPVLTESRLQLLLSPDGEGASGNVEVLLSAKVAWGLRFVGGTDEQIIDVTGGRVSSIDIAGGSRRVDLRLSKPTGTVPVRVTGSVDELSVLSPAGSPVRVKVGSGAKTVAAGTKTLRDVRPGSTLTPKNWAAPDRYDVDAASRVTLLTVRNAP
jgi:hypothetical protein